MFLSLIGSLVTHPAYGLGALTGFLMGIFYGLEGWRGSVKEVALKDSPRVKNLFWLIGVGATSIIGDIHAVEQDADKSAVLLAYLVFALVGLALTVSTFAFLAVQVVKDRYAEYSSGEALGDYLQFGYRFVLSKKETVAERSLDAKRHHQELVGYLRQITSSITIAGSGGERSHRITLARELLRSINQIVISEHPSSVTVRTNFMRVLACSDVNRASLLFVTDKASVRQCLELLIYDEGIDTPDFRLPIEPGSGRKPYALPGAPSALAHSKPIIVNDTHDFSFATEISKPIRAAIHDYFKAQSFRSFASLPVIARGKAVGVVNVETSVTYVFGTTKAEQELLSERLLPFCAALGILLFEQEGV